MKHSKVVYFLFSVRIKSTQLLNVSPVHSVPKIKSTQLLNVSPVHSVQKIKSTQLLNVSPVHKKTLNKW